MDRLIIIVGMILGLLDCQTVDSSEMPDRLIGIVGMVRLSYYQTARIVGFSDCQIVRILRLLDC